MNEDGFNCLVRTVDGIGIGELPATGLTGLQFGREQGQVSGATLNAATQLDPNLMESLRPWLHWVDIWAVDGNKLVWSGPIQKVQLDNVTTQIAAKDCATYAWRTRIPLSQSWTGLEVAVIAGELWDLMLRHHGVHAPPTVLENLTLKKFDYAVTADATMVNQAFDDLVKLGLVWTVVAGTPVLGLVSNPVAPVVTAWLAETDILQTITRIRDGSQFFNNVRVLGTNYAQSAKVDVAGLDLQTIVAIDNLYGVSNIRNASLEYVQNAALMMDVLSIPGNASLHPQAPVTLEQLIPGAAFVVNAHNVTNLMLLQQVAVAWEPGKIDIGVTLQAHQPLTQFAILLGSAAQAANA